MALQRALLSVADKTGIAAFARFLHDQGVEILSTGGTAKVIEAEDVPITHVESLVGFPHLLGGRVKTLAPQIHAGILADRTEDSHQEELAEHDIGPIDLVAVDLYPFERALESGADLATLIEEIDIGGITLLRAAAKNHEHVVVASSPDHLLEIEAAIREAGEVPLLLRRRLARETFETTAYYDSLIAHGLGAAFGDDQAPTTTPDRMKDTPITGAPFPRHLVLPLKLHQPLRYGENHHQGAAVYQDMRPSARRGVGLLGGKQLQGKQLSYNNLLDGDIVLNTVREFEEPTVVIVKHATPSGVASANTLVEAWNDAFATDTYSPFGGIVGVNRPLDGPTAEAMGQLFLEIVLAPSFTPEALKVLGKKKNLRLLEIPGLATTLASDGPAPPGTRRLTYRSIVGGTIVQDRDLKPFDPKAWKTVTKRKPSDAELETMRFAARVVKHVKSNAVVFAKGTRTVGIGGGQTARVDASWIACHKGGDNIVGSVMASDAFFPFRDAVDVAAEHGVTAIVQPGGSIRDDEVFKAADEHDIAMVTTSHRLFAH